jgi:hypothetical protein
VRLSAFLLVVSVAGVVGGAFLIGVWAVGVCVIAMSGGLGAWAVLRDVPERPAAADLAASRERVRRRADAA